MFNVLHSENENLTQYVDSFIGTAGGGNTFPGAVLPWGMVSVSPHTDPNAPSGYIYNQPYFYGLGHVHFSGTGCSDLGSIILTAGENDWETTPNLYRCHYSDEQARPGYYSAKLVEPEVQVEATATNRCGFTQFTPDENGDLSILIDAGRSLVERRGGAINIISAEEVTGYNISGGLCGEDNRHKVYFVARFNQSSKQAEIWTDDKILNNRFASIEDAGIGVRMIFNSNPDKPVKVKVGISYVSIENARKNLEQELPHWNFNQIVSEAQLAWEQQLSRIKVGDGSNTNKIKFYTALYHALIHPNIISDVNGEYPLMGQNGTGKVTNSERYSVFSLWDTYRTLHPLLTLVYPERQSAMIRSMLNMYRESGWLPKWELAGNETYMMVGDAAPIVISDSYIKGIRDYDTDLALEAMLKPALIETGEMAPPIRSGYHELLKYGYITFPQDKSQEWWAWGPVSTSLEYCLSDWAIANMAQKLGKDKIAGEFFKRSGYYKNLFDRKTNFMRPRRRDSSWLTPFDPLETEGSGSWEGSGGPGYVEGNAWNYTWFVPHDITGLINLFGGEEPFCEKLQTCFSEGHFTINNEPDIAYPYLFTYLPGEEDHTRKIVKNIMEDNFGTGPGGLPGNDDAGTISAWFVFSALGFYPACPATDNYRLGEPLFRKAVIDLNREYYPGEKFIVEKKGSLLANQKPKIISINGEVWDEYRIFHSQIVGGSQLIFEY
ncbi:MAG: GH92 family glycosyl hydrolase [Candidatus Marinimicrobia bacterium]|nr:GH92 family glycosyl hydrolase [Candidatus Neomarinimicrobiota bacterium]